MQTFLHVGCGPKRKNQTTKGFNQPHWLEKRLICIDQSSDCFKSFSVSWLKIVGAQRTDSETSGISDG